VSAPRAYTAEEARDRFLDYLRTIAHYWAGPMPTERTVQERLDGLAFSILAAIDGCSPELPALDISLSPHPDDKAYCESGGENWFELGMVINADCHLHELYYKREEHQNE
jgi:hypothetical protein